MAQTNHKDPVQQIRSLLRDNPEIFREHPELLEELDLGPEAGATVVSLEHARNLQLQRKVDALERELEQLVATARDNDRLATHLHRLTVDLLECQDRDELAHLLLEGVRQHFQVEAVGLCADRERFAGLLDERFLASPNWIRNRFVADERVSLGAPQEPAVSTALFGGEADIGSQALVPLRGGSGLFGLLALGSREASRFEAGMGTTYLERLAELAGILLSRSGSLGNAQGG